MDPEIIRMSGLDVQACVPEDWPDERIISFAEQQYPCGTKHGWQVRHQGHRLLAGCPAKVPCSDREGFVHVMLDA